MREQNCCLIFDENCNLCDEVDVLAYIRAAHDLPSLRHELFSTLGKNLRAFEDFCHIAQEESAGEYRIFKLKRRFGNFLYVFCEKNIISGSVVNMVFPTEDQSDFYSFLSPSSKFFRNISDRIIYELLYIKNRNYFELTSVSPEAFLVISRAPFLVETLLSNNSTVRFCDVLEVTEKIIENISDFPTVASSKITVEPIGESSSSLIELAVEAYAAVFQMVVAISAALSKDHQIITRVSCNSNYAEVEISTTTDRLNHAIEDTDISALENSLSPLGSYAKIASIISHIAEFDCNVRFDENTKVLSLFISIGFEKSPMPDFKFSDPTEYIELISTEVQSLLKDFTPANQLNQQAE